MLDILNTREWALVSWFALLLIGLFCNTKTRQYLKEFSKVSVPGKVQVLIAVMMCYIVAEVVVLRLLHLWDTSQLKNTIVWVITVAFLSLINIKKARQDKKYYKETIKDLFTFAAIIEFLGGVHTLNYGIELFLAGIGGILPLCIYFAGKEPKYKDAELLLNKIFRTLGIIVFVSSVVGIINDFAAFRTVATLFDFFIPVLLSMLFLPFIYLLVLFMDYEDGVIGLETALKGTDLFPFAQKLAIKHFHLRTGRFVRWKNSLLIHPVTTKQQLLASIDKMNETFRTEKHPPAVAATLGWSPYHAKDFLIAAGIATRPYTDFGDMGWTSLSDYIEIGGENKICFYVNGSKEVANSLKLCLSLFNPSVAIAAHAKMAEYTTLLYRQACGKEIPAAMLIAIVRGQEVSGTDDNYQYRVVVEQWPNHKLHGYGIIAEIKMK